MRQEDGRLNMAAALDVNFLRSVHSPGIAAARLLCEVGWPAIPGMAELNWRGTPALTWQPARAAGRRVLAIGDAIGYVEPFTGEGIGWALDSALSVAPIAERAAHNWQERIAEEWSIQQSRVARRRRRLCRAITWVSRHPVLARSLIGLVGRYPWLAAPFG